MAKYLTLFDTHSSYEEYIESAEAAFPNVSYCIAEDDVHYNREAPPHDYSKDYLTFEITSDGVIKWKTSNTGFTREIEYKLNDGEWTSITSTTGSTDISVVSGDTVQFRGDNTTYATGTSAYNTFGGTTASFNVKGNIMSLIDSDDFVNVTSLTSSYTFANLFNNTTGLTDASKLILPATTLANSCYQSMFNGCTSLTTAPELPATTLANNCYLQMFAGCTSLTSAPVILPATTLAPGCYNGMFQECSSLTSAPELPATTLAASCYTYMFRGCTSLNYIKCLATDISAFGCTRSWVDGVASTGTFVKNASMPRENWLDGANGIPYDWTVQDAS